jgi:hypothetical protein
MANQTTCVIKVNESFTSYYLAGAMRSGELSSTYFARAGSMRVIDHRKDEAATLTLDGGRWTDADGRWELSANDLWLLRVSKLVETTDS